MESVSFDRAASFYDATRGFLPGVAERIATSAARFLKPASQLLEIGVGTGRIAKPFLSLGYPVTGVDLSRRMMQRLTDGHSEGALDVQLVQGDATRLPLLPGTFEAVLAVHVLHLIPGWMQALQEARRVISPSGSILVGYNWHPQDSPSFAIRRKWRELASPYTGKSERRLKDDFQELKSALSELGASYNEWVAAEWTANYSLSREIEMIEQRVWSSTWSVPESAFPRLISGLKRWATGALGSLEKERTVNSKFIWQRYHWD